MDTRFLDLIREDIEEKFSQVPQKFNEAMSALSLFEDGYKDLLRLGVSLPLKDLPETRKHEFPLMLYKGPDYRIVANDREAQDAVADGYQAREDAHSEGPKTPAAEGGEAPAQVIVGSDPVPKPTAPPSGEAGSTDSLINKIKNGDK